jgi:hypothetical protein
MTFATIKTDPYKKGLPRRRQSKSLWSEAFWRRLVGLCCGDQRMNDRQLLLIRSENARMYGSTNE